jgi:hypothetical protein
MSCIPHCRLAQNKLGTMGFTARLPPSGSAQPITHSLLNAFKCCLCIDSKWSRQTTAVPSRVLSSGPNYYVSSTFNRKLEESASGQASMPCQAQATVHASPPVSSLLINLWAPSPRSNWNLGGTKRSITTNNLKITKCHYINITLYRIQKLSPPLFIRPPGFNFHTSPKI